MMDKEITVWITKYALSKGIQQEIVEQYKNFPNIVGVPGDMNRTFCGEGKDWHRTLESAKDRAEAMRREKIKSLEKQFAKLEAMKF